jgi:GNAT superfamily N-acetyltransferase
MSINPSFSIRSATISDASLILTFIKELATYEGMEGQVVATEAAIEATLFSGTPTAYVLIAEEKEQAVGFALYFHNYSTFLCKYGIYIEDIYVREAFRGKGYGKAFFQHICQIALKKDCGRVEWWCLDWNKPSINFYTKSVGAKPMIDWTVYRLDETAIQKIAYPTT